MRVNWIIENITKEQSYAELAEAVTKQGFPLQNLNGSFSFSDLQQYQKECVVFNGSIQMSKMVNDYLRIYSNSPIIYCSWDKYLCTAYYNKFSNFLFNDNYVMVPYGEVMKRKYFFYGLFGREAMIFLRPDCGDKSFKGGLIDLQDFDKVYEPALADELAIVSTPKNMIGEWRYICSKYKDIIAVSSYRYQGLITRVPSAPAGATELCQKILDVGYFPDSVFCVDIVQDGDGKFWLMELNSFSSAGLYACNKEAIVKRVSEIAWEDYNANMGKKNIS